MNSGRARFRSLLESRSDVLRLLLDGPTTKAELSDQLEVSRSTIDRAIRDLESVECLTRADGGFVASTTGRLALTEYDRYCERTQTLRDSHAFLSALPDDAPITLDILHDATITIPTSHAPEEALQPSIELLREATTIRGTAPVVLSFYPDLFEECVREDDLTVELILADDVLATLPNMMSDRVGPFVRHENVTLYRAGEPLPYALWVMDTPDGRVAGITAYDAGGVAGLLVNDSPRAVEWVDAQYEQCRKHAKAVESSSIRP